MDKTTRARLEGNIWKYYLFTFLIAFAFFFNEVLILYYQQFGLTYAQIGTVTIVTFIFAFLFEVPTGAFADLYGRRWSIVIGITGMALGFAVLALGSSMIAFLIAAVVLGIASAFNSGASEAIVYDSLKDLGRETEYVKVQSRATAIAIFVGMFSAYFGPWAFSINVRIPFIISASVAFLVILLPLWMHEQPPRKAKTKDKKGSVLNRHMLQMKDGFRQVLSHHRLLWLIAFSTLFGAVNSIMGGLVMGPYIISRGFDIRELGVVCLISTAIQTAFVFSSETVERYLGERKTLALIVVGTIGILISFSVIHSKTYLIGVLWGVFWGILTYGFVVVSGYVNAHLVKKSRATVLSISSMSVTLACIPTLPLMGAVFDATSLSTGMLALAGIVVVGVAMLFLFRGHRTHA